MSIQTILESGKVERFHAVPGVSPQSVAEHAWGVSILLMHFYPAVSKRAISRALTHDCHEIRTGDIPAPMKWECEGLKEMLDSYEEKIESDMGLRFDISKKEADIIKVCDCLEGMSYCLHRVNAGERSAIEPFDKWADFLYSNMENHLTRNVSVFMETMQDKMEFLKGGIYER